MLGTAFPPQGPLTPHLPAAGPGCIAGHPSEQHSPPGQPRDTPPAATPAWHHPDPWRHHHCDIPKTSACPSPTSCSLPELQPPHCCFQPDPCTVTPPTTPVLALVAPSHCGTADLLPLHSPASHATMSLPNPPHPLLAQAFREAARPLVQLPGAAQAAQGGPDLAPLPVTILLHHARTPCHTPTPWVLSTCCASPRLYMVRRVPRAQHHPNSHSLTCWLDPQPGLAPTALQPALRWQDPRQDPWQDSQCSPCPAGHCLLPLHCSRHQRRANCPKISQEGGWAGKAPLNTHPQQKGGPWGRNLGPLWEAGVDPGSPWPCRFGPHPRCPQMEHGCAMPWPKP